MPPEITPDSIHSLLVQFGKQHWTRLQALMNEIGLYRGQPPLLHLLWQQDGRTQSDLAAKLHLQPATVTKMLQRMEAAGFIKRQADPQDQRVMRVYLTPLGQQVKEQVRQREQQVAREVVEGFTCEEQALLAQFFSRMRDNLSQINRKSE
jgi:DNA-binding MarR family transcriptional regulator